jgi:hypothetical protein
MGGVGSRRSCRDSGVGVFDVAAIPSGFVAVGRSSEGNQPGVVATADSDLTRWTLQPADPVFDGALASAVLVSPDGAYLVGVGTSVSGESVFLLADPSALVSPTWAARALGFAVAIGLALWGAYVVACVVVQLGAPRGSANLARFIGFAAFESSVYVLLGTVFVTIPLGCLWVTLLRLFGPSAGLPPSAL